MEKYQLAKLYDFNGDLSRRWYVEYKYLHPEHKQYKKFRIWISERLLTKHARYIRASEIKDEINNQLRAGFNPFVPKTVDPWIREAVEDIVLLKQKTCRRKSWVSYKSMTGKFLSWIDQHGYTNMTARDLTQQMAVSFLDHLLTKQNLSKCTYNCYLMCMKTIFTDLKARKLVSENPFSTLKKMTLDEPDLVILTNDEKKAIKENLPHKHFQLYCVSMLVYYCFLRPAEIMRLQVQDIDFENYSILVNGNKSKNKKRYYVTMPMDLARLILSLNLQNYPGSYYIFSNNSHLTPGPNQVAPTRVSELWKRYVKEPLNIDKGIYDLKHNGNGDALLSGVDIRQIQLQNRHWSLEQTQIYLNKFNRNPGEDFRKKMPSF